MFGIVFITDIEIIIILRYQVHIVQEEAVPVFILQGFSDTNIKQLCSVKRTIPHLLNQVDSVAELLALQERMNVVEKMVKVFLLVTVCYKDG